MKGAGIKVMISLLGLVLTSMPLCGQKIEWYTGALYNKFYDTRAEDPYYQTSFQGNFGYSLGLAIDSLSVDRFNLRVSLQYDLFSTAFTSTIGGKGAFNYREVQINKQVISFSIFPINVRRLFRNTQISLGITGSFLGRETLNGEYRTWNGLVGSTSGRIEDQFEAYSSNFVFGIQALFNYRIRLSEKLEIVPHYSFYLGLSNELIHEPSEIRSLRHYFSIGLSRSLN